MSQHVFHRSLRDELPLVVGGQGLELVAANGRRYLDACGGAAVSSLGHAHPAITQAIIEQAQRLAYAHSSFFTNSPAEELAEAIARASPGSLNRVYFVGGGSEAVETALKMCRQYHLERGEPQRRRLISRRQSYHGNTLGALAAGGNALRRAPYEPLLMDVALVNPCFVYHYARAGESASAYGERAAAELEAEILRVGPENVMAFIAETVVGATAGAVPPAPGYFQQVRAICDRYGVLLVLDEVMCGAGRTGTFLACEQDGVIPDIVLLAKGLGAGYQPIGAALCSDQVYDTFAHGSGAFQHGHTYSAHAIACAAALAVQRVIREEGLLQRVVNQGHYLQECLQERFGGHPHVGEIRGRGLLQAIELVRDRAGKTPFDPTLRLHARIRRAAFELGLMVYPGGGTIDGKSGDHVLLAPAYIVERSQIDEIVERLGLALQNVLQELHGSLA
ncbi:MAG: aspartate aminotransferase family protein [Sinobacteraceae bacterium]|nr:aspartate aminotransferase family protein [Nevskiaceae bacterium]